MCRYVYSVTYRSLLCTHANLRGKVGSYWIFLISCKWQTHDLTPQNKCLVKVYTESKHSISAYTAVAACFSVRFKYAHQLAMTGHCKENKFDVQRLYVLLLTTVARALLGHLYRCAISTSALSCNPVVFHVARPLLWTRCSWTYMYMYLITNYTTIQDISLTASVQTDTFQCIA